MLLLLLQAYIVTSIADAPFAYRRILPDERGSKIEEMQHRRAEANGTLKHLVVLMKFRDHVIQRDVPSKQDYDVLFNQEGGDPYIAPTGSVKDVFLANSYGQLSVESTVINWVPLSERESYYADGVYGLENAMFDALQEALDQVDSRNNVRFSDFDSDNDGQIDAITFVHSGYGAEWGGADCGGAQEEDRIWSHHRTGTSSIGRWCARDGICMGSYQIVSGLWGKCGKDIARIGVISHELSKFLGLNGMYDGTGGSGVGAYSLMVRNFAMQCRHIRAFLL